MITLAREGSRLYFCGDTYSIKDDIKRLGGHWDGDSRRWWIGLAKQAQAEQLVQRQPVAAPAPGERAPEDPDKIRLTGKGKYKGRSYYLGAYTRVGDRVRLLTLPGPDGKYLDFWADVREVTVEKTYQPRTVGRGRYASQEHTTLGSIARFIARQSNPATRRGQCYECGEWGPAGEPCSECGGEGSYV
jgi:hypothetical protein